MLVVRTHHALSRGDTELQPTFKIKMSRVGDVCTLQMSGVTLKMSGEYKCVAVNSAGEAACVANVSVVGKCFHMNQWSKESGIVYT